MKPPRIRIACGTYAGVNAHKRYSEQQCDRCRAAQAEYMREWRRRTGRTTSTLQPIDSSAARRPQT